MSAPRSVARRGNPACPSLRADGCWGAIPLRAREQPAPDRTPSWGGIPSQHSPAVLPDIPVLPRLLALRVQHEAVTGWHPTPGGAGGTRSPWARHRNVWQEVGPLSSGHCCQVIILHLAVSMATCWLSSERPELCGAGRASCWQNKPKDKHFKES